MSNLSSNSGVLEKNFPTAVLGTQTFQSRLFTTANPQTEYRSTLDSLFPPVIQTWILCFPCDSSKKDTISDVLKKSLEQTLEQNPPLGGRLEWESIGRLKLIYTGEKAEDDERFVVNDLTEKPDIWPLTYAELENQNASFASLKRPDILSPPGGYQRLATLPICAQANFISGGCLLYVALHHSLMDGIGAAEILKIWARNCKALQAEDKLAEDIPRVSIKLPAELQDDQAPRGVDVERIQTDVSLWQTLGLQKPNDITPEWTFPTGEGLVPAIFSASREAISRLKTASTPETGFISSFDAIAALLWKSIMRARQAGLEVEQLAGLMSNSNITSHLRFPVNVRKPLGISPAYIGNASLFSVANMPLESLVAEKDGRYLAAKVRSTITATRDIKRGRDAIKLSFMLPHPSKRIPDFSGCATTDVVLSSWADMPFYQMDWGKAFGTPGTPQFVRTDQIGTIPGLCAILQRKTDEEVEVLINLYPAQMKKLRQDGEFKNYFQLKSM